MNPAAVRAAYRRGMLQAGSKVVARRYTGSGVTRPYVEAQAMARVMGFRAEELVGGITQGDRKVIMLAEDLELGGFPLPLKRSDVIMIRGKEHAIKNLDDETRRINDVLMAYDLVVTG